MKRLGGIAFGFACAAAAFSAAPAAAGPFGATASIREMSTAPIVDVQVRRARPVGRPGRPVVRGRGRGNGAAVAAGLVGAAILGGAIIANSQPRRRYYDDSYYYDGGDPYYGSTGYVVQQPQPYYGGPAYYHQPRYTPAPRSGYVRHDGWSDLDYKTHGLTPPRGGYHRGYRGRSGLGGDPGPSSGK